MYVKYFYELLKVEIWILGVARFSKPNFLMEFEAAREGIFKISFFAGFSKIGPRHFFRNLKFPEFHVPSIQNELMLS